MKTPAFTLTLAVLASAANAKPAVIASADAVAIRAEITRIYKSMDPVDEDGVERKYAASTEALYERWNKVRNKDVDDGLADFDWDCGCQDWTEGPRTLGPVQLTATPDGRIHARFTHKLWPGGKTRRWHISFVKEQGRWMEENIWWPEGNNLVASLMSEIRAAQLGKRQ